MPELNTQYIADIPGNALNQFMSMKQQVETRRLMPGAMSGDASSLNQLMAANPEAGMQVAQMHAQMAANQRQIQQQQFTNMMALQKQAVDERKADISESREKTFEGMLDATNKRIGIEQQRADTYAKMYGASSDPNKPLDDSDELIANQIAAGKKAPLTISAKAPQNKNIMARVYALNPQYNEQDYKSGQAAYTKFTSGDTAKIVKSLNVGISHLDTLDKLTDALNNNDMQATNKLYNSISNQFGGTAITNFNAAKQIVADEVVKSIVGGQNAAGDREEAKAIFDAAQTPQQLKQAIVTVKQLMAGQLSGMKTQYKAATGRDDFEKFLEPSVSAQLEAASKHGQSGASVNAPQAAIQHLRQNPSLKDAFDQKYGKGSADKVLSTK